MEKKFKVTILKNLKLNRALKILQPFAKLEELIKLHLPYNNNIDLIFRL